MNDQEETYFIYEAPKIIPPEFRLYYDEKGNVITYTCEKLEGNYLDVNQAYSQDGLHLGSPKTYGRVLLPAWLAEEVRNMTPAQVWKKGMTTKMVSGSIYKISRFKEAQRIVGNRPLNPHMLRHWFATDMVKRGINPEIQARQIAMQNQTQTVNPYGRMGAMQPTVYNPGNVVSGGYAPQS